MAKPIKLDFPQPACSMMKNIELKHENIVVNNINYQISSLKDRQQFHDEGSIAHSLGISSATWPLFGVVWPASRILADTVCSMNLKNKRVLEIGCGIALSSIVLHKMGVNITASDYHPLAQQFLEANVLANNLLPIKYLTGNWETENSLLGQFDLIIGSDVLYEPAHAQLVSDFIYKHSANKNVEVIIVDPNRRNRVKFTKKMDVLGFTHHFNRFNFLEAGGNNCRGRILHYNR